MKKLLLIMLLLVPAIVNASDIRDKIMDVGGYLIEDASWWLINLDDSSCVQLSTLHTKTKFALMEPADLRKLGFRGTETTSTGLPLYGVIAGHYKTFKLEDSTTVLRFTKTYEECQLIIKGNE